jgi:hypothetical protein
MPLMGLGKEMADGKIWRCGSRAVAQPGPDGRLDNRAIGQVGNWASRRLGNEAELRECIARRGWAPRRPRVKARKFGSLAHNGPAARRVKHAQKGSDAGDR